MSKYQLKMILKEQVQDTTQCTYITIRSGRRCMLIEEKTDEIQYNIYTDGIQDSRCTQSENKLGTAWEQE